MKRKNIYFLLLSIIGCILTTACSDLTDDEGSQTGSGAAGFLSLQVNLEDVNATKAAGTSEGIGAESNFYGLQLIFYYKGVAVKSHHYQALNIWGDFQDLDDSGITYNPSTKVLTIPPIAVEKKSYTVIALLNSVLTISSTQMSAKFPYTGKDYHGLMQTVGHSYSLLTDPVNIYTSFDSDAFNAAKGTDYLFWADGNGAVFPNEYTDLANSYFLMTNANGPLQVNINDIKETASAAAAAPVALPVERAVAKVGLFKGSNLSKKTENATTVYNGLSKVGTRITEPVWATDILNLRTYLIRRPALTNNLTAETANTDAANRYAEDPNFTDISREKPGSTGNDERATHFFYLPKKANGGDAYLTRNWIPVNIPVSDYTAIDDTYPKYYQYVTENTMAADEQYEDVTTRIVLKCQYVPAGFNLNDSYYYYRGYAFSHALLLQYRADPSLIPVDTYPELADLAGVLADLEVRETFWPGSETIEPLRSSVDPNNPPLPPTESVTKKGLTYYKYGESYYAIPIRHFDDTESSALMGYGRYGVVRNNVYRVVINDVRGPGHIDIPDPEGPDDKEGALDVYYQVTPWRVKNLHFDF
ncbi:Mfa1 family fimbria major subunit [Parabacteroides sp. OttesenSCG-928-G06]|nr:Mfa1 family fimbria major subunit [Parabacteroides sp. OttesenSCG-928-K15]MDL2281737.1 Mfa1 family fimbria major subunit [Parabacteroides sp. OttesenSCG-928-G06]